MAKLPNSPIWQLRGVIQESFNRYNSLLLRNTQQSVLDNSGSFKNFFR